MKIDAQTRLCATLAYPNRKTTAPAMHNAGFDALDLNFRYVALEPADIGKGLQGVLALGFVGVSISKPYKEAAVPHLDSLDETAGQIGAVNIAHVEDGKLVGYNSDWIGAIGALKEKGPLSGRRVAVLGSGGAARAIVYGLKREACDVSIFARSQARAEKIASDMDAAYGGSLDQAESFGPDVLINATSIGSSPDDDVPVSDKVFETARLVMDIVNRPNPSNFLRRADASGAACVGGLRMLVLQGAFTFELFTGVSAPVDVMQRAVEAAVSAH